MTWTKDMDGLIVAVSRARSRREAIEVVATWRAVPRMQPAPEPAFEDDPREDPEPYMPVAVGARMVLDGLKTPTMRRRGR